MKAVVTYMCIVNGCGNRLGGLRNEDGQPMYGVWFSNMSKGKTRLSWTDVGIVSDPPRPGTINVICKRHGPWSVPRAEMIRHWHEARASKPMTVKLDEESSWRNPDIW